MSFMWLAPCRRDLLRVIEEAPDEIRQVALDRGDIARYKLFTENLEASLIGLTTGGRLGEIFSRQTTTPMRRDRRVVYDVPSIEDCEADLQATILLACCSAGFGTVNVATALAEADLAAITSLSSTSCGVLFARAAAWSIVSTRSGD